MASADNVMVKIEVKASDLVDACIKALVEDGTLVEVVRCKDCKNHEWCSIEDTALNDETFFCKWGEMREQ